MEWGYKEYKEAADAAGEGIVLEMMGHGQCSQQAGAVQGEGGDFGENAGVDR